MPDMSRAMPAESQWDLLEEYGLNSWFDVAWIDVPDTGRAAACFRADPDSAIPCDLDAAFARAGDDTQNNLLWIGAHSLDWSVAVAMSGSLSFEKEASASARRIFTHKHMADIYELSNEGMLYYFDGKLIGTLGVIEEFQECTRDLEVGWDAGFRQTVESFLILAGRITGRFLDRDWFATPRVLYRIPGDAWSH
ncbi:hypothetical protein [Microbispora hainanensis]|uniref:Uncharacterized protein n=1 Tax=Microbispora hainanensis TaxID=568844 RepID=A0A544XR96_9ACTN|nr:hypothetical protein [Microbispora hainanensis]TQS07022.1 hypothetical protein FLX08_39505 [Microbispora hainanensis]